MELDELLCGDLFSPDRTVHVGNCRFLEVAQTSKAWRARVPIWPLPEYAEDSKLHPTRQNDNGYRDTARREWTAGHDVAVYNKQQVIGNCPPRRHVRGESSEEGR
jgi:hypothetical protein